MIPLQTSFSRTFALEPCGIFGLGISGLATAQFFKQQGIPFYAFDDNKETCNKASQLGINIVPPAQWPWSQLRSIIWSAGIPHRGSAAHPVARQAHQWNIPLMTDCDVMQFWPDHYQGQCIGVTGTNGKSSTVTLLTAILTSAGRPAVAGGNIGIPVLDLPPLSEQGTYVLELSSYQLELLQTALFDVGILLNITPDHLQHHESMSHYIAAKQRLFDYMRKETPPIVGIDQPIMKEVVANLSLYHSPIICVSGTQKIKNGIYLDGSLLIDDYFERQMPICEIPPGQGLEATQNLPAAYAAARLLGCTIEQVAAGLHSFKALPHRQEHIGTFQNITYIDDSKATNADATLRAFERFLPRYDDIYWIAGGEPKADGIDSLRPYFPQLSHTFLIGQAAPLFSQVLTGPSTLSHTLENAVQQATEMALQRPQKSLILLSPACASTDQFRNFVHRGQVFREIITHIWREKESE